MLKSTGPADSRTRDVWDPGQGRNAGRAGLPCAADTAAGRWAGTGLPDDLAMPPATAPPDRLPPGRTIARERPAPRSFPKPPLLKPGRPRGSAEWRGGTRRPLLAAGGVLIALVCAALGAVVANRAPRPVAFLAVARLVPVGMIVTAADLETVSIPPVAGLDVMRLRDARQVVGRRATEDLQPGSLLVPGDLASRGGLPKGVALVGTSLAVDQMPADLATGERVLVVLCRTKGAADSSPTSWGSTMGMVSGASGAASDGAVPSPTGPPGSVLTRATVVSLTAPGGSLGLSAARSTDYVATLEVPEAAAAAVTAASAMGDIGLAVIAGSDDARMGR